ncbi:MAG: hypothetical protein QOH88_584 [Verrucomicrobiota bacterium]|jgi:hypothetical protein
MTNGPRAGRLQLGVNINPLVEPAAVGPEDGAKNYRLSAAVESTI